MLDKNRYMLKDFLEGMFDAFGSWVRGKWNALKRLDVLELFWPWMGLWTVLGMVVLGPASSPRTGEQIGYFLGAFFGFSAGFVLGLILFAVTQVILLVMSQVMSLIVRGQYRRQEREHQLRREREQAQHKSEETITVDHFSHAHTYGTIVVDERSEASTAVPSKPKKVAQSAEEKYGL